MSDDPTIKDSLQVAERLRAACVGHPNARIPWPHRLLHDAAELARYRTALERIIAVWDGDSASMRDDPAEIAREDRRVTDIFKPLPEDEAKLLHDYGTEDYERIDPAVEGQKP